MSPATNEYALNPRQERILCALCRQYLATGAAVSSSALRSGDALRWSTATIRAELATLEGLGFLHQPHHSAGRLPSALGIRRYVELLPMADRPTPTLAAALQRSWDLGEGTPQGDLKAAASLLSHVVDGVAVSFFGQRRTGRVEGLEVVPLVGPRMLVAVEMDDGSRTMHPITIEGPLSDSELGGSARVGLQERLRWLCIGRTLDAARTHLLRLMSEQEAMLDALLAEALRLGLVVCSAAALDPLWMQVAGQSKVVGSADDALGLLEDYHRLAQVLCQMLPEAGDRPRAKVCIGSADSPGSAVGWGTPLSGLALVGCRLPASSVSEGTRGGLALLAPDRMDYERVIPLIEYAARALASRMSAPAVP